MLHLDGGGQHERTVRPALPLRGQADAAQAIQLDLETHPPSAGIVGLELHAQSAAPYRAQHGLFLPQAPEPGRLEVLLARLRKLLGEERVGSPLSSKTIIDQMPFAWFRLRRHHRDERERRALDRHTLSCLPSTALGRCRALRPCAGAGLLGWQRYAVREIAGPWRVSGQWWSEANWCREEWDVRLATELVERSAASRSIHAPAAGMCRGRMTDYVELHARSAFSFLEGATMPEAPDAAEPPSGDAGDGAARPQRSLWRRALSHGGKTARGPSAYRRGGRGQRPRPTVSTRRRISRISFRSNLSVCRCWPSHALGYQNLCRLITQFKLRESNEGRRRGAHRGLRRVQRWAGLPDGWHRRPVSCCIGARRI